LDEHDKRERYRVDFERQTRFAPAHQRSEHGETEDGSDHQIQRGGRKAAGRKMRLEAQIGLLNDAHA
jgi:hypothetical protein